MTEADEDLERKIKEDRQRKSILQQVCLSIILFDSKLFSCNIRILFQNLQLFKNLAVIACNSMCCLYNSRHNNYLPNCST